MDFTTRSGSTSARILRQNSRRLGRRHVRTSGACRRTAHPVELSPSFAADPGAAAGCCATISRKADRVTQEMTTRLGNGASQLMCAIGRRQPANFFTTDAGLFASTSYSYRVRASGPGGLSAYSNAASATTANFADVTAPILSLPGNITTTATSLLGAIVTFKVSATDNVDPSPTVRCSPL